jgi:ribose transport system ATP-binding protein
VPVMQGEAMEKLSVSAIVDAMLGDKKLLDRVEPGSEDEQLREGLAKSISAVEEDAAGEEGRLVLEDVSSDGQLRGVNLTVSPGEIVGLAGIAGSGHLEVLELISGQRQLKGGRGLLPGGARLRRTMRGAVGSGVAIVTGDRRRYGLMLDKPIWENVAQIRSVALARDGLLIGKGEMRRHATEMVNRLGVKASSIDQRAGLLSGGNQQKLVFAKWLDAEPSLLLLDDPTRGVDVGAKAEMHDLIRAAADAGAIVLLASTDLDEITALCDRVAVFFGGRVCAELEGDTLRQHGVLEAMNTGEMPGAAAA